MTKNHIFIEKILVSGKLFPNPNNGIFTLGFTDEAIVDVEVTDAMGRNIITTKVEKQQQFNLPQLAGGVYFIRLSQDNETRTLKFSVIR